MSTHGTTPDRPDGPVLPGATFDRVPHRGDPPGWYPDPTMPRMYRCWDGAAWLDSGGTPVRRPRPASEPLPRRVSNQFLLGSVLPLVGAVVLPLLVMRWLEPANGVGSLAAWERAVWSGVLLGWVLWATSLIVWKGTEESYEEQLHRSYDAAASWHGTCKALVISVLVLGVLGTLAALFVLAMTAALSGVGSGL